MSEPEFLSPEWFRVQRPLQSELRDIIRQIDEDETDPQLRRIRYEAEQMQNGRQDQREWDRRG